MSIKVLIADDHALFRQGLRSLLETEKDIHVVGEASDGLEVQHLVAELQPDVVLMDIKMPIVNGVAATQAVLSKWPEAQVVVVTMYEDDGHVADAIRAGAKGYILKTAGSQEVVAAVRAAHQGGSLIDPRMASKILQEFRRLAVQGRTGQNSFGLTDKELAVLRLITQGHSNKEIAKELNYSESTVKNRVSVLFEKIGTQDRTQAAIYALTHGLVASEAD